MAETGTLCNTIERKIMMSFHCHSNLKYVYARVAARGLSVFPARRNSIQLIFGFVKTT